MNTNDLNLFIAAAEHGSLTKAAALHHTVQSNVSARIKSLEDELQIKLFTRSTRHIELTPEGTRFLKLAKEIRTSIDDFKSSVGGAVQGVIKMGCLQTTAALRAPDLFRTFSQEYPEVAFKLKTGTTPELIKEVLAFKLDGAFVAGAVAHADLDVIPVVEEELCIVSAGTHPGWAQSKGVKLIVFSLGCSYRAMLNDVLTEMNIKERRYVEMDTLEGIINTVEGGGGITLLPAELIQRHYAFRNLVTTPLLSKVPTVFIKRKDFPMSEGYIRFFASLMKGYSNSSSSRGDS